MTVLPNADGGTPQPIKRKRLSLKPHSRLSLKYQKSEQTTTEMDSMSGITAFFPSTHRIGPYSKYEPPEPSRGSTTDDSPASENTSSSDKSCPPVIATLANLGNTCFLNSVLYTLRFTPQFLHQLHHMVVELSTVRPVSAEDLSRSQLTQIAVETLHDLFQALRGHEENRDLSIVPLEPSVFHMALREVNPTFETHQQHDAHELLVCLLDNVRETCLALAEARNQTHQDQIASEGQSKGPTTRSGASSFKTPWSRNGKKRKAKAKEEQQAAASAALEVNQVPPPPPEDPNFIAKDFEGVMVLKTMCLECEAATERKETFSDICLQITNPDNGEGEMSPNEVFKSALLSSDFVRGTSKYYCEECMHMNEARRCTRYETLPRILTLQLKRFTSSFGSMFSVSKVNDYMPTPLHLSCFCESCCQNSTNEDDTKPAHSYQLFAVIMHLGITMASGHYVSYVKANDNIVDYCHCEKNNTTTGNGSSGGGGILKFLKSKTDNNKISSLGANVCRSSDCCGIRLSVDQGIDFSVPEQAWLECDDENVNILTTSEFEDVLSKNHTKHSSLTPYLLFYVRSTP